MKLIEEDPGFHNLISFEETWIERPGEMDFLSETSPLYLQKKLSTRIYWDFIDFYLPEPNPKSVALDAACGIGRFAIGLAERFSHVMAFDPCLSSLRACKRYLEARKIKNVDLNWADLSWLDELPKNQFDAVLAVELICYTTDPKLSLERLVRVASPGAKIFISVEGAPGALTVQNSSGPADLLRVIDGYPLHIHQDRYVTFYNEKSLKRLMDDCGLKDVTVEGSHYLSEGPFWNSVDQKLLSDPRYLKEILQVEQACRKHSLLAPWARVFCAVGTV